jgi:putative SOS response-associated peptidase YedK
VEHMIQGVDRDDRNRATVLLLMCGRATLVTPVEEIAEAFEVAPIPIGPPRYNMAPGQPVVVVRHGQAADELALLKWGLRPWWTKADKPGKPLVQARLETVAKTPSFRDAFRARRCLVVVDGFYEWKTTPGEGGRIPHHVRRKAGGLFAIAGVWDRWRSPEGEVVETCAVVTTEAAGPVRALHDRMPMVLDGAERDTWLHGSAEDATALVAGARESQTERAEELVVVPVSRWVNDVKHDDPRCMAASDGTEPAEPLGHAQLGLKLF